MDGETGDQAISTGEYSGPESPRANEAGGSGRDEEGEADRDDVSADTSKGRGGNKGRRFGRPISFIWEVFTTEDEPWKLRQSECLHCKKLVSYHKKSEYVLVHLNRCAAFLKYCKDENKMELMYFVVRHMEEASRVKRLRRRKEKIERQGGVVEAAPALEDGPAHPPRKAWQVLDLVNSAPPADCVPERLLRASAVELLASKGDNSDPSAFLYDDSSDYFAKALAPFLKKCSGRRHVNPDLIIPVGGVADALHLIITMQLKKNGFRPGGFVYVEERTPTWVCDIFFERGLLVRTLAADQHGLVLDDLRLQLQVYDSELKKAAYAGAVWPSWPLFLYLMPSFNNPTGVCLSPARRLELLELTSFVGLLVVSDDTFALLDFSWEIKMLQIKDRHKVYGHYPGAANPIGALGADKVHELKPLVDFCEFKNVLSVSSFCKVISSDLAVGWIEASDPDTLRTLKAMAREIAGGTMSHFTACVIAHCLKKDHADGEDTVAANMMKNPDLYRHVCDMKNTYAKRYHHLTSALIRYSNMLLPPGDLNQIRIEGFSDYPDGHVDNVFQLARGSMTSDGNEGESDLRNAEDNAATDSIPKPWLKPNQPQWKTRIGGYYIWVKLPVWVRPRPLLPPGFPMMDRTGNVAPPMGLYPDGSFHMIGSDRAPLGPPSLQWFVEKARNEFNLDFKLDIECSPMGPNVIYTPFVHNNFPGVPAPTFMSFGPCGTGWRYVRMCFVRYDENALDEAAERFINLLAKVYAECTPAAPFGYVNF